MLERVDIFFVFKQIRGLYMDYERNWILDKVYDLADQKKYDEARKFIADLTIPADEKARLNMHVWQIQQKEVDSHGKGFDKIPMTPVISMILGFVVICSAFFFKDTLQTVLVTVGLIMAGVIPAIYCFIEKRRINKTSGKYETESHRYVKEGADINYVKPEAPAWVVGFTILGVGLIIGAMAVTNVLKGAYERLAICAMLTAAFVLFFLCCKNRRRHDSVISMKLLAVCGVLYTIFSISAIFDPANEKYYGLIFCSFGAMPLLLYPVTFAFIKRKQCTVKVEAECVDCTIVSGLGGGRRLPDRYYAFWKYSYEGVTYVHRDMASYKKTEFGEFTELFIAPSDPHNVYRRKLPITSSIYIAAGFFMTVYAFLPFIGQ